MQKNTMFRENRVHINLPELLTKMTEKKKKKKKTRCNAILVN